MNIEGLLDKALAYERVDDLEVLAIRTRDELTRFTDCQIHQNVASDEVRLYLRAWVDGKTGVAETNEATEEGVRRAAQVAEGLARRQTKPAGYSPPGPQPAPDVPAWDQETWDASPKMRAELVARVVKGPKEEGFNSSGSLSTGGGEIWVASTTGVRAHTKSTRARFVNVVSGQRGGSGYAEFSSVQLSDFRPEQAAQRALDKALRTEDRQALEPGEYTVVLEEPAVATVLGMLSFMGFSARALLERRSFMDGRLNQKLASDLVTVYDDPLNPRGLPRPFDFEGVPTQRVYFFRQGVAEGVVHDTRTAVASGTQSTGHALPPPYSAYSPMPGNVVMEEGALSDDELLAGVERGLLVTRFHYARPVEPREGVMTMMTRDGTFLIEDGKVRGAVDDLRVTESGLRALSEVDAVGGAQQLITGGDGFGGFLVPKVRIRKFKFTGRTER
ncbi:MAG: TldD/PmbA family protein [Candidatus Bipolaricaulota bacterium]